MDLQCERGRVFFHGDEKIRAQGFQYSGVRSIYYDERLNEIDLKAFQSLNSSLGWLGVAASPFCAHAASVLQQKWFKVAIKDIITQVNILRPIKNMGSTCRLLSVQSVKVISELVFSDASRKLDHGQLGYIGGILFWELHQNSTVHSLTSSRKSKRPVKSVAAVEIIIAGEAVHEGNLLRKVYERLLRRDVDLILVVAAKDFYDSLSTCHNPRGRSIRAEVNFIRFNFETGAI